MPIYEYICNICQNEFEKIVFNSTTIVKCPKCEATNVQKKLSLFSVKSSSPSGSGKSSCGSCTSKNCSSCG